MISAILAAAAVGAALPRNDPAGSWLTYAVYSDPQDRRITMLNTSWVVPDKPKFPFGSNAPGWWFGTQTAKGDGALVQPILAWGYEGDTYTLFNGVFDWTDGSWHTSPEKQTVQPGDRIYSSVYYVPESNAYTMVAYTNAERQIVTTYQLLREQRGNESTAYFVLEHQPRSCGAYPPNGVCTFEDIYMEVDGAPVVPEWKAMQEQPACDSKTTVVDPKTLKITWSTEATSAKANTALPSDAPMKWGAALV